MAVRYTDSIVVRVSQKDRQEILAICDREELPVATWCRRSLRKHLRQTKGEAEESIALFSEG